MANAENSGSNSDVLMPENTHKTGEFGPNIGKSTQWPKGFCPNPGGRPKKLLVDHALEELLLADGSRAAREIALALLQRAKAGDVRAAQFIAERTEGKPRQKIEDTGDSCQGSITVSFVPSLVETIKQARQRAAINGQSEGPKEGATSEQAD